MPVSSRAVPFTGQHTMKHGFIINSRNRIINVQPNEYLYCKWFYFQVNGQVADIPFTLLQGKIEVSFNDSKVLLKTSFGANVMLDGNSDVLLKLDSKQSQSVGTLETLMLTLKTNILYRHLVLPLAKQLWTLLAHTSSLKLMIVLWEKTAKWNNSCRGLFWGRLSVQCSQTSNSAFAQCHCIISPYSLYKKCLISMRMMLRPIFSKP